MKTNTKTNIIPNMCSIFKQVGIIPKISGTFRMPLPADHPDCVVFIYKLVQD